jgi:glycosyltransferase involved in cell wall biosynthesis
MKIKLNNILYVVIPCYNEEEVLAETTKRLTTKLNEMIKEKLISNKSKIMYVNDGSKDKTWELITKFNKENKFVCGVNLSRNRGHQNALLAGLMTAKEYADIVISMDADLQDDINVMDEMVKKYNEGCDIVYGVRSSRKTDTWFKKTTAQSFYKIMKLLGVDVVYNHADYRLMSKRTVNELENYKEVNLFLRGIIPLIGFKSDIVYYERNERFAGESKYPLKKMLNFALEGILSFSVKPLRIITTIGFLVAFISFIFLIYVIVGHFITGNVAGWTTIVALICFFGGFQIFCIGVIGEYIGKIYSETKQRPRYIIESVVLNNEK